MAQAAAILPVAEADRPRIAIRSGDSTLDYGTLAARVDALAQVLSATPSHSVVGIRIGNEPAFVVAFLACLLARRPAAPLDPLWSRAEWGSAMERIDASILVHTGETIGLEASEYTLDPLGRIVSLFHGARPSVRYDMRDVAVVHWSSGSTGIPKPMAVSNRALACRIESTCEALGLGASDRMLCFVPLSHCHGLDCISLPTLAARGELVLLDPLAATPRRVVREIGEHGITVFSAFPRFYALLVRERPPSDTLRSVRLPLCGSAALSPRVARGFARHFGTAIRNGYGLTEVGLVAMNRHEHPPARVESVGRVLPGIEWRIDEADEQGVGELWVRSPGRADSYLLDDETAGRRLVADGWLRTQDLARVDAEGYLYVVGRTSSFINVNGAKADPREIEDVIETLPWVAECAVKGMASDEGMERIVAFVVPRSGAETTEPEQAVRGHVGRLLGLNKVPAEVILLDSLPRSSLGKILYPLLTSRPDRPPRGNALQDRRAVRRRPQAPPRGTATERAVAQIWCDVLGLDRVGVQDNFTDVGGTSAHLTEIQLQLHERIGLDLTITDLFRHPTVQDQARLLGDQPPSTITADARDRARRQREAFQRLEPERES